MPLGFWWTVTHLAAVFVSLKCLGQVLGTAREHVAKFVVKLSWVSQGSGGPPGNRPPRLPLEAACGYSGRVVCLGSSSGCTELSSDLRTHPAGRRFAPKERQQEGGSQWEYQGARGLCAPGPEHMPPRRHTWGVCLAGSVLSRLGGRRRPFPTAAGALSTCGAAGQASWCFLNKL